jgi:hypothetical protein
MSRTEAVRGCSGEAGDVLARRRTACARGTRRPCRSAAVVRCRVVGSTRQVLDGDELPHPSPKPSSDDNGLPDAASRCAAASGGLSLASGDVALSTQHEPAIDAEAAAVRLLRPAATVLLPYSVGNRKLLASSCCSSFFMQIHCCWQCLCLLGDCRTEADVPLVNTILYFWDAATDLFGKVSSFGPGWLF